jgi:hypothetical protein
LGHPNTLLSLHSLKPQPQATVAKFYNLSRPQSHICDSWRLRANVSNFSIVNVQFHQHKLMKRLVPPPT